MTEDPLFLDTETEKEIKLAASRRYLVKKVNEEGLSLQNVRGYSLRIGGHTAYANLPNGGAIKAGFLGLGESGARWSYMHAHCRPLETARVAIDRESGSTLAVRAGPVSSYARGSAPG